MVTCCPLWVINVEHGSQICGLLQISVNNIDFKQFFKDNRSVFFSICLQVSIILKNIFYMCEKKDIKDYCTCNILKLNTTLQKNCFRGI